MQQNNTLWLGLGLIIALILAGGLWFFTRSHNAPTAANIPANATTTVIDLGNGQKVTAVATGAVSVSTSSVATAAHIPVPPLTGTIYINPSLDPATAAQLRQNEQTLIAQLQKTPQTIDLWLELGIYRKEAGDYKGAIDAWVYITKLYPQSFIAYADLGDLYQNFDVNYAKAEANYLEAIKLNPKMPDLYVDLYNMYSSQYHISKTAAANIIAQGLKANPGNAQLTEIQKQLQVQ